MNMETFWIRTANPFMGPEFETSKFDSNIGLIPTDEWDSWRRKSCTGEEKGLCSVGGALLGKSVLDGITALVKLYSGGGLYWRHFY